MAEIAFPQYVHDRRIRRSTAAEQEIRLLPLLCSKDKLAVDIGANQGLYVHHFAKLTSGVIAFEPIPAMQEHLKRFYSNTRIEGVALSDREGLATLRMPSGNTSWATIAPTNNLELADRQSGFVNIEVPIKTLDSYGFTNVAIVKIDVEGNEEAVLRGAKNLINSERPNLVVEIEERHNPGSIDRVDAFMTGLRYHGFFFHGNKLSPMAAFNAASDQPVSNVGVGGKSGRYINNFIFVPAEKSGDFNAAVSRLLDPGGRA
jgi:FkbM family methyltransferase